MKKFILILSILSPLSPSYSQSSYAGRLTGIVTDTSGQHLEYVYVAVEDLKISTVTDENGGFVFNSIPKGNHFLKFKLTGYEIKTSEVNVSTSDTILTFTLQESLIETPTIEITATFTPNETTENSSLSTTSLDAKTIMKESNENLGKVIEKIAGVNNITTGSGIGKPVIRGLSSQSVIIVRDGVKQETQQWGDEHGPEISVFDIERLEILRGPASIIYGADGIGGAINILTKPMQFSHSKKMLVFGELNSGANSVSSEGFGNLSLGTSYNNFGIKGNIGYRKSGDVATPDGNFIVHTPEGDKVISGGKLFNSGSESIEGGFNIGFNFKPGRINAGFELLKRELQIHDDPAENPLGSSNQTVITDQLELSGMFEVGKKMKLEPVFSYQLNDRKEFGSVEDKNADIQALHLRLKTFDANLKLHHELAKNIKGTFGASFTNQLNSSLAEEKLVPGYGANSFGVFAFEQIDLKKFTISVGGRFDTKKLHVDRTVFEKDSLGNPTKLVNEQNLTFNALTGSVGAVYKFTEGLSAYSNIGRGWRAPSEYELFVDGIHEGTGRYDKGLRTLNSNSEPKPELSLNVDVGIRFSNNKIRFETAAYRNEIDNFIYPAPTGAFYVVTDPNTGDTTLRLPIYDINQAKSVFYGYEYNLDFQPLKWFVLNATGDYVISKNFLTENPLPFTPASKNILGFKVQKSKLSKLLNPYAGLELKFVSAQNMVDPLEAKTDRYTLLNASAGFEFPFAKSIASVDFSVDNLLNTKYVDHMSRYRYYALNPGRSFNLHLSAPFSF